MTLNLHRLMVLAFSLTVPAVGATKVWSPPSEAEMKERVKKLTPDQFRITKEDGTEPPYRNAYWDNHGDGLYVDVISGEPLFSSRDKFESGTGWPSFSAPLNKGSVLEKTDRSLLETRTEVRSKVSQAHLGHVFNDGPQPSGKRYCMNSGALRFIPKSQMAAEGYSEYLKLFAGKP